MVHAKKYEGRTFAMIHRSIKPARLTIVVLALCFVWFTFRIGCEQVIPVVHEIPLTLERPVVGDTSSKPTPRVAKISVAVNNLNSSIIHRALRSHKVQNDLHSYIHYIATNEFVSDLIEHDPQKRPRGAWTKPAYILSIIIAELNKPESERLDWVFWFDADTIVMNPYTPLEIFLPPDSNTELSKVNLLMAANWDGLNSGAFAIRVNQWSVSLLSAVLAYPIYYSKKQQTDRFRDQSAFQWLLLSQESPLAATPSRGKDYWVEIPMRWFNSLPINNAFARNGDWIFNHNMTDEMFDKGTNEVFKDGYGGIVQPWKVMQGDMSVHFAGASNVRNSWMNPWLERAESFLPSWSNVTKQVELKADAEGFWNRVADRRIAVREREKERAAKMTATQSAQNSKPPIGQPLAKPQAKPPPPAKSAAVPAQGQAGRNQTA